MISRRLVTTAIAVLICMITFHLGALGSSLHAAPFVQADEPAEGEASPFASTSTSDSSEVGTQALRDVSPDEVARIAKTLNCPLCQGYSLQECPLEVCAQMRDLIRQSLAEGESAEDIRASFVDEYGPQVLNAPPAKGFFLSAWWTPVLVLLGGAIWLTLQMRREQSQVTTGQAPLTAGSRSSSDADTKAKAYEDRVEALLRENDET